MLTVAEAIATLSHDYDTLQAQIEQMKLNRESGISLAKQRGYSEVLSEAYNLAATLIKDQEAYISFEE